MSKLLVQHTFHAVSGLPEDDVVNTFHFNTPDAAQLQNDANEAANAVDHFFWDGAAPVLQLISSAYAFAGDVAHRTIKVYNLDDPVPRVPLLDTNLDVNFLSAQGDNAPSEAAICLSFQADKLSGVPQARRRGRVFIGPIRRNAITAGNGVSPRPAAAAINSIKTAAAVMLASSNASARVHWAVHSSYGTTALVTNGWVDDALDTQRRRGVKPTARTLFP